MKRFYEKKDHLIRRNPNLKDDEKQEIIRLLNKHPSYENKIDWNKNDSLTYEDFLKVLRPLYINELDLRGLIEGEDYDILYESDKEVLYSVYSYDASRILASNNVEPEIWTKLPFWCGEEEFDDEAHAFGHFDSEHGNMKPGAKWCISMQTSDKYWKQYRSDFHFLFWFRNKASLKNNRKIAIGVRKTTWKVALLYNGADNELRTPLPSYIIEAIENEKDGYKEKEINGLKSMFTLNPQTNRYDYEGNLGWNILSNFVSEDGDGFTINFGKITGNFDCSYLDLKSLKGVPTEVSGFFNCSNNKLTSLKGAPQTVKSFYCSYNQLTSLEGAPQKVYENFWCHNNQLTSLKGAPTEVGKGFNCYNNRLTSLVGAPQKVGGDFVCYNNQLTSLEGAPQEVKNFVCSNNKLTSLEGAPNKVEGLFDCSWNFLTDLKGSPEVVKSNFNCSHNDLISLEGAPKDVWGDFNCTDNKDLKRKVESFKGLNSVWSTIYTDYGRFESPHELRELLI